MRKGIGIQYNPLQYKFVLEFVILILLVICFNKTLDFVMVPTLSRPGYNKYEINLLPLGRIHPGRPRLKGTLFNLPAQDSRNIKTSGIEFCITNMRKNLKMLITLNKQHIADISMSSTGLESFTFEIKKGMILEHNELTIKSNHIRWRLIKLSLIQTPGKPGEKEIARIKALIPGFILFTKSHSNQTNSWHNSTSSLQCFAILLLFYTLISIYIGSMGTNTHPNRKKLSKLIKPGFLLLAILLFTPLIIAQFFRVRLFYSPLFIICLLFVFITILTMNNREVFLKKGVIIPGVITLIYLLFILNTVISPFHKKNFSSFIRIMQTRSLNVEASKLNIPIDRLVMRNRGYDCQFYYFISFDPFLCKFKDIKEYNKLIDDPRYRCSRIGFPLLINLFSLGRKGIFPEIIMLIIIMAHYWATYFLLKIIEFYGRTPNLTFLYLLVPGFLISMVFALPESLATAFLLGGYYYYLKNKPPLFIALFSFSILIRESGILFIAVLSIYDYCKHRELKRLFLNAACFLPYITWRAYLTYHFYDIYRMSTMIHSSSILTWPFLGFIDTYEALLKGNYKAILYYDIAFFYPMVLITILFTAILLTIRRRGFENLLLLVFSLLFSSLNYEKIWCHIGNGLRVTSEVFIYLILALLVIENKHFRIAFYINGVMVILILLILLVKGF